MSYFKAQKDDGNCLAINRDKIISIHVFPSGKDGKKNNIKLFIETEKEDYAFELFENFLCEENIPYLCQALFDDIMSYADNVDILLENLKRDLNKKIMELSEKKTRCPKLAKQNWYDEGCEICQWFYRDGQMRACHEREKEYNK